MGRNPLDDGDLRGQSNREERPSTPKVRAAIGTAADVLMIDATATIVTVADIADIAEVASRYALASGTDPQSTPGFVYIQLVPERIQLWTGAAEFTERTVMRAGVWLEDPIE